MAETYEELPALTFDQPVKRVVLEINNDDSRLVVRVLPNGGVEFGEGFTADEAAKEFWKILGRCYPGILENR